MASVLTSQPLNKNAWRFDTNKDRRLKPREHCSGEHGSADVFMSCNNSGSRQWLEVYVMDVNQLSEGSDPAVCHSMNGPGVHDMHSLTYV